MHVYEVGKPYIAGKANWPEGGEYNCRQGQHELRLFLRDPTAREVDSASRGEAEFALVVFGAVIFFLYRFGAGLPWSDAPYSIHLVPAGQRELPPEPVSAETRALLTVILVDAVTGILRAIRAVSLSPAFTRELAGTIRRQAEQTWDPAYYDAQLPAAYQKYPSTEAMLADAVARSRGGA